MEDQHKDNDYVGGSTNRNDSSISTPLHDIEDFEEFTVQYRPVRPAPVPPKSQTTGRVSHFAKETSSTSESAQNASFFSLFPSYATVSQPLSSGQLVSRSRGSEFAWASNASAFRPYQMRHTTQLPPTCVRAVQRRIDLSVPASGQAVPPPLAYPTQTSPVPPQAQIADFLPFPAQTARPGSRVATETALLVSQDQLISGPRGSGLAKASNAPAGSFQRRHTTEPRPTCSRAVQGRIDPSVAASAQAAPPPIAYPTNIPIPSREQIDDFISFLFRTVYARCPSPGQTARPGSQLARGIPPPVLQELLKDYPPRRPMCFLCMRHLVLGPATPYPCGHCYDTGCLLLVASNLQNRNPPCVLCLYLESPVNSSK